MYVKRNAGKAKPQPVLVFLFNDMVVIAEKIEEKKTLRGKNNSGEMNAGAAAKYRPKETLLLFDVQSHLLKDHLSINVPQSKSSDAFEILLTAPEGVKSSVLVEFVKKMSKARLNLESSSNSSNISRKPVSSEGGDLSEDDELPAKKRTPSDPISSSNPKIEQVIRRSRAPSDPSKSAASYTRESSPQAAGSAVSAPPVAQSGAAASADSPGEAKDIEMLIEQTKLSTIDTLNAMITETEEKASSLLAAADGEANAEEQQKLLNEAKVLEGKASVLRSALKEQQSGMGQLAKQNRLSRSNTEPMPFAKPRSFSLRGSPVKESPAVASPQTAKKGLFGTTRRKKSDEKE
jgi:hypothetical protein